MGQQVGSGRLSPVLENDEILDLKEKPSDVPSLKKLYDYFRKTITRKVKIDGKEYECMLTKGYENTYIASLEIFSEYKNDPQAEIRFKVEVDDKGNILNGVITRKYKEDKKYFVDEEELNASRSRALLSQFQFLAVEMKEKQDSLPKMPNKVAAIQDPGFRQFVQLLSEDELRRQNTVLLKPEEQESPWKYLPKNLSVPSEIGSNHYIHTKNCTVVVERTKGWKNYSRHGVLIMYFPTLSGSEKTHKPSGEKLNQYNDAVIFPYTENNGPDIVGHWDTAYQMIRQGKSSEEVYEELRKRAESIEHGIKDKYTGRKLT